MGDSSYTERFRRAVVKIHAINDRQGENDTNLSEIFQHIKDEFNISKKVMQLVLEEQHFPGTLDKKLERINAAKEIIRWLNEE